MSKQHSKNKFLDVICIGKINRDVIKGKEYIGGSATNTACALAKLGLRVGIIVKVGNDKPEIVDELKSRSIDTSHITFSAIETGSHQINITGGKKEMKTVLGANALLLPKDVDEEYVKKTRILHISSLKYDVAKHAAQIAEKHKIIFSIDTGYEISSLDLKDATVLLKNCKFFFPTENELLKITKTENTEHAIRDIMSTGLEILILKRPDKIEFVSKNERFSIPIKKGRIVDPIGIGDSFAAGFIYSFIKGKSHKEAIRFGVNLAKKAAKTIGGCYY